MPIQITLDSVKAIGTNLFKEDGQLRIEANYQVLAGADVIRNVSRDITIYLSVALKAALAAAYDDLFSEVAQMELSAQ